MFKEDVNRLLQALARDLGYRGKSRCDFDRVLRSRKRFLEGGLAGAFDGRHLSMSDVGRRLQFVEFASKAYGLDDVRPESASNAFVSLQASMMKSGDDVLQMDDKDLRDLSFIACRITSLPWSTERLAEECRHGPGTTYDGLTSVDKWLGAIGDREIATAVDPLGRLPRVLPFRTSKYYDVPKTAEKNRGICAEQTEAQFLQQGIGRYLARCVRPFADTSNQQRNRLQALQPGFCTLDLSSASDRVTLALCDALFEPGIVRPLEAPPLPWYTLAKECRSVWCAIPGERGSRAHEIVELSSMASMGNGFCFPLLTIVAVSVCMLSAMRTRGITCYRHYRRADLLRIWNQTGCQVYGDDIVVCDDDVALTRVMLERVGLKVNTLKSSVPGSSFKETCGLFTYQGRDLGDILRLRRCDESVDTLIHLCDLQRRAVSKYYTYLGAELALLVGYVAARLNLKGSIGFIHKDEGESYDFSGCLVLFTCPHPNLGAVDRLRAREFRGMFRWMISCAASVSLGRSKRYQKTYANVSKVYYRTRSVSIADGVAFACALSGGGIRQIPQNELTTGKASVRRTKVYCGTRSAS